MARRKAKDPTMEAIRAAVTKHRGGWEQASDAEILVLWLSLPASVRREYLEGSQGETVTEAPPVAHADGEDLSTR